MSAVYCCISHLPIYLVLQTRNRLDRHSQILQHIITVLIQRINPNFQQLPLRILELNRQQPHNTKTTSRRLFLQLLPFLSILPKNLKIFLIHNPNKETINIIKHLTMILHKLLISHNNKTLIPSHLRIDDLFSQTAITIVLNYSEMSLTDWIVYLTMVHTDLLLWNFV